VKENVMADVQTKLPPTQLPATTPSAPVRPSPADLAKRINEKYLEIVSSLRTTFIRAVEIGELLEQAKDRVGHNSHCQLSLSTARRYMKLAEDRPKIEEQLKLETQQSGVIFVGVVAAALVWGGLAYFLRDLIPFIKL
jgi:hypothetical protein